VGERQPERQVVRAAAPLPLVGAHLGGNMLSE
jgi:hypothetical protein